MLNENSQLANIKKSAKDFYFQQIIPGIGSLIHVFKEPKRLIDRAFPSHIGMWLAVALGVVGLLVLTNPESFWKWQFLLIMAVLFLGPLIYKLFQALFSQFKKMLLVYPGKEYVGKTYILEEAIKDGINDVDIDGNAWHFSGDDMPSGTSVKVIAVKDNILYVVAGESNEKQLENKKK